MKSKAVWIATPIAGVLGIALAVMAAGAGGATAGTTTSTSTPAFTLYDITATSPEDTGETLFDGTLGVEQDVTISGNPSGLTVSSNGPINNFSFTCDSASESSVVCDFSDDLSRPFLKLRDAADRLTIVAGNSNVKAKAGSEKDVILGGRGAESFGGGAGDDRIDGGGGADAVNGGDDTDVCKAAKEGRFIDCETKKILKN